MLKINKIIILYALCLSTAFSNVSWNKTTQIYERLIKQNHLKRPKALKLIMSRDINAWVDPSGNVSVTSALLDTTTEAELALVLGHELTHYQYNDTHTPDNGKTKEDRADKYGRKYAGKLGYSECEEAGFFLKLYWKYGNNGGPDDPHSSNLKRFWRIYKYCKSK